MDGNGAPLLLIITMRVLPGQHEALRDILLMGAATARKEKGCLLHRVTQDQIDPDIFVVIEHWADEAQRQRYLERPGITRLRAAVSALLAGPRQRLYATPPFLTLEQ